jgi:hypothetical protein
MVGRGEITDKAWEQIVPLLSENGRRGGQWSKHCKVVKGILWRLGMDHHGGTDPPAKVPDRPATTASCAGGGMTLGSAARPRPDQSGRSERGRVGGERGRHGLMRAHQSTWRAHAQGRATKTRKGAWPLIRGSTRKQPWRLSHQGPSRLRWQRQTTFGGSHARTETRKHPP